MDRQNIRLFLLLSLVFLGMFIYNLWQQEQVAVETSPAVSQAPPQHDLPAVNVADLPVSPENDSALPSSPALARTAEAALIEVTTDVLHAKIDPKGGDVVFLELLNYPISKQEPSAGYVLMDHSSDRVYIAQSGLLSQDGPDSVLHGKSTYKVEKTAWALESGADELVVPLRFTTQDGVLVTKQFVLQRGSYVVKVRYQIDNQSNHPYKASMFGRLKRNLPTQVKSGLMGAMRTYTGGAIWTPDKPYLKLPFDDMRDKAYRGAIEGGWVALVEHYFTSAWIPEPGKKHHYQTEVFNDDTYGLRFISPAVQVDPGQQQTLEAQLFAGPEETKMLQAISPGLELTIDYGALWWLCQPIFYVMKAIFGVVGNWGAAIILITLAIKLLFYPLSATSYRSMGNMRRLQPKIEALKQRYGEDKQQLGQAMMALYREEKINPLGGCLPIIVQIPVFIALYWVLLESVELRQAPFALWIQDLSLKDPYYVLPIIMGISMFVQQRLNPAPPDPIQAKVMMFMPVLFTVLFFQFPAGLVLYWVVNNCLSIAQQWMITRRIEQQK